MPKPTPVIKANRILIVEVNWIGDVLFSTPFIRAIRNLYPDSFIACMFAPRTREILELNPAIDKLIVFDEEGAHRSIFGKLKFISELKKLKFDTVFFLHRSLTRRFIAYLAGIKNRVGYPSPKGNQFLTHSVDLPSDSIHKVEYFLNIAKDIGADTEGLGYEFYISGKDRLSVEKLLKEKGIKEDEKFVVLNPGGNWDPKRWPKENFGKLADMLIDKFGVKIVITGANKDKELAYDIKNLMKNKPAILTGSTNLKELGALMAKSSLVVANDSGPMHIAVSQKVNTIALFGPTKPELTGPYGKGNFAVIFNDIGCEVPCYDFNCNEPYRCMGSIKPEDVIKKIEQLKFLP